MERAGGFTDEVFLGGSTLYRKELNLGYIIVDIDEAVRNNNSVQDIIMQQGDEMKIPKIKNLISIVGTTSASELYPEDILKEKKFNIPYE